MNRLTITTVAASVALPFEPYSRLAQLGETPCAVIQASEDNYLAASRARDLYPQAGEGRPSVMNVPLRRPTSGPQARQDAPSGQEK